MEIEVSLHLTFIKDKKGTDTYFDILWMIYIFFGDCESVIGSARLHQMIVYVYTQIQTYTILLLLATILNYFLI